MQNLQTEIVSVNILNVEINSVLANSRGSLMSVAYSQPERAKKETEYAHLCHGCHGLCRFCRRWCSKSVVDEIDACLNSAVSDAKPQICNTTRELLLTGERECRGLVGVMLAAASKVKPFVQLSRIQMKPE